MLISSDTISRREKKWMHSNQLEWRLGTNEDENIGTHCENDDDGNDVDDEHDANYERWKLVEPSFIAVCSRSRILSREE